MKKRKVLLVAYNNLGKGGIQNQIMGIVRTLKDKVDFDIVIWDNVRDHYRPELEQAQIRIIECFRSTGRSVLRRKADAFIRYGDLKRIIDRVIKKYGPYDAIHCNNAYDAAPCLEAAYENGIPVRISHAHNTENPNLQKKLVYPAYKALYAHNRRIIRKYATHMIGCSKQVTDYFFGEGHGQVIHIGIDLSELHGTDIPAKKTTDAELLHVGNMSEQKNQLFLVEVMEELVKLQKDVHLTLIGGGTSYLDCVKQSIAEKQLEHCITLKAPETNVPQAMAAADLFVFPSTFEGFGIVLIEAQALGLPCIASDIVSPEANCGSISYYPLNNGAAHWAKVIHGKLEASGSSRKRCDVSEFSVTAMAERIYDIYQTSGQ